MGGQNPGETQPQAARVLRQLSAGHTWARPGDQVATDSQVSGVRRLLGHFSPKTLEVGATIASTEG